MKVTVSDDELELWFVQDLQKSIRDSIDAPKEKQDVILINALVKTLKFYSTRDSFNAFIESIPEFTQETTTQLTIDSITDNVDGSAVVNFTATPDMIRKLAEEGLKYQLMKLAAGNVSDDEIFERIRKG